MTLTKYVLYSDITDTIIIVDMTKVVEFQYAFTRLPNKEFGLFDDFITRNNFILIGEL